MNTPQLIMRHDLTEIPPMESTPPYIVRPLRSEDLSPLSQTITEAFEDPSWTEERCRSEFVANPSVPITFVAIHPVDGVVATSSCQVLMGQPYVHMVAARSSHKGKGLGLAVVTHCLQWHRENGATEVFLSTDDHRLAAITTYLRLGFRPHLTAPEHELRWNRVLEAIASRRP
ncbi:MAG: GNAT family N-acetyltransferase [Fimbriimonadaceae bacterium]